jgi:NAD(P)-dependent dehydrogenase (short-subunit alcohol dehydrogenase family)
MGDVSAREVKALPELFDLKGQTALVTGGTTGLGYAIANRLAEAGANTVLIGRNEEKGAHAEKEFRARGFEVSYCSADITVVDDCYKAVKFAEDKYGQVDILVNNAARWCFGALVDQSEENYDKVMDLNIKAMYFMTQAAARSMIKHRSPGKIVNIASTAYIGVDSAGTCMLTTYNASKGAVVSFTIGAAKELKQYGINVNCIAPGGMDTYGNQPESQDGLMPYMTEFGVKYIELSAPNRLIPYCNPDEVALMVFAFCTEMASYVYGETLKVSGGSHLSFQGYPFALTLDIPEDYEPPRKLRKQRDGSVGD